VCHFCSETTCIMGSLLGKQKQDDMETPSRDSVLKRIEDPRSPTEEISRTPIEVTDDVPKESLRQLAFANSLKLQNKKLFMNLVPYIQELICVIKTLRNQNIRFQQPWIVFPFSMLKIPVLLSICQILKRKMCHDLCVFAVGKTY